MTARTHSLWVLVCLVLLAQPVHDIVSASPLLPQTPPAEAKQTPKPSPAANKDANLGGEANPRGESLLFENASTVIQPLGLFMWGATLSPDGKTIATAHGLQQNRGEVRIWDVPTEKVKLSIPFSKGVRSISFSPDGKALVTACYDGVVRFHDPSTFTAWAIGDESSGGHKSNGINSVCFFKGGKYIATGGFDYTVRIWDVPAIMASRRSEGQVHVSPVAILEGHKHVVMSVAGTEDGRTILSGCYDMKCRLWDVPEALPKMGEQPLIINQARAELGGHESALESVAISPDGQYMATGAQRGKLRVRDKTGINTEFTAQFDGGLTCAAFSKDGKYVAVGGGFYPNAQVKEVRVWELATKKQIATRTDFSEGVKGLEFTPDGKTLIVAIADQTVHVWPWADAKDQKKLTPPTQGFVEQPLLSVAVSPDGALLAFSGESKSVFIFSRTESRLVAELPGHEDVVAGLEFSPDSKTLASSSFDKSIKLWDSISWKEKRSLSGHTGWVFAIAYSPDGMSLASASYDKTIRVWDVQSGELKTTLKDHTAGIRSVAFSPDGRKIVSGGSDRVLRLWDAAEGKVLLTMKGHKSAIRSVAYSPDGKFVASGSEDQSVKIWDLETAKETHTFSSLPDIITAIRYSPKGQTLVAATLQGPILILDPISHRTRQTLNAHSESVSALAFSDNGQRFMSVSQDRTIRQWTAAKATVATPLSTMSGKLGMVTNLALAPNGNNAVLGAIEGSIVIWDVRTDALRKFVGNHPSGIAHLAISDELFVASIGKDGSFRVSNRDETETWKGKGTYVAFTPNGKQFAVAEGKDIVLYDTATGKVAKRFVDGHDGNVVRFDFNPAGTRMISAGQDTKVRLWNVANANKLQATPAFGNESAITHLAFSSDGVRFAVAAFGPDQPPPDDMTGNFRPVREVRIFSLPNQEGAFPNPITFTNQPNNQPVAGLHWTGNPMGLAIASSNGSVRLVELNGNGVAERQRFTAHESAILSSSVSLIGGVLISAGEDMAVRRWRLPGIEPTPGQARVISSGLTRVWEVLPSPDGKYIATAGEGDKTFRVYANIPSPIPVEPDNYPAVISMAFSPDNRFLVTGHTNGILIVREAATGKPIRTLTGTTKSIVSVAFAEKGAALITAGGNSNNAKEPGEALVWDFPDGKIRQRLNAPAFQTMIAVHPDGKSVAISSADGRVRVWDVGTGKLLNTYGKGGPSLKVVAFDSTGGRIAAGGFDHAIRIWDTSSGAELRNISTDPLLPTKVLFSPDGKEIVVSAWYGGGNQPVRKPTVTAYSIDNPSAAPREFAAHPSSVMCLAFLPDGKTLIAGGGENGGTLRMFDFATARFLGEFARHRHWVQSFAVSADGKLIASTSWAMWATGEFRLWDPRGFRPIAEIKVPGEAQYISSGAIGLDGKLLILGGWGKTLTAWDMTDPRKPILRKQFKDHEAGLRSVAFDDAGKRFVTSDEGGNVKVWDAATLELIVSFKASTNGIYRAKFTPDGTKIVTVSGNWQARTKSEMCVWDPKTGMEIGRFPDQPREVWDIVFLNGGRLMAAVHTLTGAPDDANIKVWDFERKEVIKTLLPAGSFSNNRCLGISADGKHLAIGSSLGPVKVFETTTWKEVLDIPNLTNCTFRVDFSRDGNNVLIASGEGAAVAVRIAK
jgi:WD40 repeat protein